MKHLLTPEIMKFITKNECWREGPLLKLDLYNKQINKQTNRHLEIAKKMSI